MQSIAILLILGNLPTNSSKLHGKPATIECLQATHLQPMSPSAASVHGWRVAWLCIWWMLWWFSIEFQRTMEVELDTFGAWEKKEHLSSKTHECNRGPIVWGNKRDGHRVATKRRHASMFKAMVSEHSSDLNCL